MTAPAPSISNYAAYHNEKTSWVDTLLAMSVSKFFIYGRDSGYLRDQADMVPELQRDDFINAANNLVWRTAADFAITWLPEVPPDEQLLAHVLLVAVVAVTVLDSQRLRVSLLRQVHANLPGRLHTWSHYGAAAAAFAMLLSAGAKRYLLLQMGGGGDLGDHVWCDHRSASLPQ